VTSFPKTRHEVMRLQTPMYILAYLVLSGDVRAAFGRFWTLTTVGRNCYTILAKRSRDHLQVHTRNPDVCVCRSKVSELMRKEAYGEQY